MRFAIGVTIAALVGCAPMPDNVGLRAQLADRELRFVNVARPGLGTAVLRMQLDGTGTMQIPNPEGDVSPAGMILWRVLDGQLCVQPAPDEALLDSLGEVCSAVAIEGDAVTLRTDRGEVFAGTLGAL